MRNAINTHILHWELKCGIKNICPSGSKPVPRIIYIDTKVVADAVNLIRKGWYIQILVNLGNEEDDWKNIFDSFETQLQDFFNQLALSGEAFIVAVKKLSPATIFLVNIGYNISKS